MEGKATGRLLVRAKGLRNVAALAAGGSFSLAFKEGDGGGRSPSSLLRRATGSSCPDGCEGRQAVATEQRRVTTSRPPIARRTGRVMVVGGPDESEAGGTGAVGVRLVQ